MLTIFKLIINLIVFIVFVNPVFAINAPTQTSPLDKSTVSSSTLTWETIDGASQYHIIVDDEPAITSPYVKNYYATKNQYSPKLDNKTYYWKLSAKDTSGSWSAWSPIWSFTLVEAPPSPSPKDSPKPAATKTPTPKTTPPSPSPSPSPAPTVLLAEASPELAEETANEDDSLVVGVATEAAEPSRQPTIVNSTLEKQSPNFFIIAGIVLVGLSTILVIYSYIKPRLWQE